MEHGGVNANDPTVTLFNPPKRWTAGESPPRDDFSRQAPSEASVTDVQPELRRVRRTVIEG